ncbi:MAG TPA: S8 family serine peptidase [Blastocatellia bacterium]|nr:S8 family serine peptidase [Blastocatellia bacterium]
MTRAVAITEPFDGCTGRGVRVAIVDSGVNPEHPHVGGVARGVGINLGGELVGDYLDHNGHGTAVAGVIREKAPDAELFAIKVFDRKLTTNVDTIIKAIEWAIAEKMDLINLSLATNNPKHAERLHLVARAAARKRVAIVSACSIPGSNEQLLPGSFPEVFGVGLDWECPRDSYKVTQWDGKSVFLASGYPRDIPGVPPERNLSGISFAVANMAGFVARALQNNPEISLASLKETLAAGEIRHSGEICLP